MRLVSFPVLVFAAILDSQALWRAFVTEELPVSTALIRYLIAVVVSVAMVWVLSQLTTAYTRTRPTPPKDEIIVTAEQVGTPYNRQPPNRPLAPEARPTAELPPGH
ncbi:hypothetical protein [Actinomadura hibisca]|uniref:hypothetical protein n=1 Tax=Actinomadura hibisca TaxID=68565 RepID=UPI000831F888|nr:hypothetical protein [Actinomadura hibisca]